MKIKRRKIKSSKPKVKQGRPYGRVQKQEVKERRLEALKLRMRGWNFPDIGAQLGVSAVAAWKYVDQELKYVDEKIRDKAERLKVLEILRLDRMVELLDGALKSSDYYERFSAIDRVLKIMDRRARYIPGMDVALTGKIGLEEGMEGLLKSAGSEVLLMLKRLAGEEEEAE